MPGGLLFCGPSGGFLFGDAAGRVGFGCPESLFELGGPTFGLGRCPSKLLEIGGEPVSFLLRLRRRGLGFTGRVFGQPPFGLGLLVFFLLEFGGTPGCLLGRDSCRLQFACPAGRFLLRLLRRFFGFLTLLPEVSRRLRGHRHDGPPGDLLRERSRESGTRAENCARGLDRLLFLRRLRR